MVSSLYSLQINSIQREIYLWRKITVVAVDFLQVTPPAEEPEILAKLSVFFDIVFVSVYFVNILLDITDDI